MNYALITGATSGIGFELAKLMASNNQSLILVARNLNKLEEIKKQFEQQYKVTVQIISSDLSIDGATKKIFDYTKENGWDVQYLINNAGFGDSGFFLNSDLTKQEQMIHLNIIALVDLCHLFGNEMKEKKAGSIVNISSIAALVPGPYMSTYFASKSFVLSFSESLYEELKPYNISVSCILPGPTESNFAKTANVDKTKMFSHPMDTSKVAKIIYKSIKKKKAVTVIGLLGKFMNVGTKFASRRLCRTCSKKTIIKRK